MEAHARRTDPETSHAAARSVVELTAKQGQVLHVLRVKGPMTDVALAEAYRALASLGVVSTQSESGIRTRRNELTRMEKVVRVSSAVLPSGRRAIVWKAAE